VGRIGVYGGYLGPLCSLPRLIPPRGDRRNYFDDVGFHDASRYGRGALCGGAHSRFLQADEWVGMFD
jgi:hypothetical protein